MPPPPAACACEYSRSKGWASMNIMSVLEVVRASLALAYMRDHVARRELEVLQVDHGAAVGLLDSLSASSEAHGFFRAGVHGVVQTACRCNPKSSSASTCTVTSSMGFTRASRMGCTIAHVGRRFLLRFDEEVFADANLFPATRPRPRDTCHPSGWEPGPPSSLRAAAT